MSIRHGSLIITLKDVMVTFLQAVGEDAGNKSKKDNIDK